jgi:hypothetical protein
MRNQREVMRNQRKVMSNQAFVEADYAKVALNNTKVREYCTFNFADFRPNLLIYNPERCSIRKMQ